MPSLRAHQYQLALTAIDDPKTPDMDKFDAIRLLRGLLIHDLSDEGLMIQMARVMAETDPSPDDKRA